MIGDGRVFDSGWMERDLEKFSFRLDYFETLATANPSNESDAAGAGIPAGPVNEYGREEIIK